MSICINFSRHLHITKGVVKVIPVFQGMFVKSRSSLLLFEKDQVIIPLSTLQGEAQLDDCLLTFNSIGFYCIFKCSLNRRQKN